MCFCGIIPAFRSVALCGRLALVGLCAECLSMCFIPVTGALLQFLQCRPRCLCVHRKPVLIASSVAYRVHRQYTEWTLSGILGSSVHFTCCNVPIELFHFNCSCDCVLTEAAALRSRSCRHVLLYFCHIKVFNDVLSCSIKVLV